MLGTIILAAISILLLVVFILVGIALLRRLGSSEPKPRQPRPAQAAPPPQPQPQPQYPPPYPPPPPPMQPQQAAPQPQPQPQPKPGAPPPAPAPASPPSSPTPMGTMVEPFDAGTQGTEMLQWYGMLVCTSGMLEGQRFIVEDEGFYIGRDPALSKVVIPDGRISKRHVRIVPRNGKVHAIDQDSTNGTYLGKAGGERITDVQLKRGDTLVLADGAATFLYQI